MLLLLCGLYVGSRDLNAGCQTFLADNFNAFQLQAQDGQRARDIRNVTFFCLLSVQRQNPSSLIYSDLPCDRGAKGSSHVYRGQHWSPQWACEGGHITHIFDTRIGFKRPLGVPKSSMAELDCNLDVTNLGL